ncbi:hypothetical protein [Actinoplanes missouriensis]|nr:hypothetical protein [Actinoplanes missouriensis]
MDSAEAHDWGKKSKKDARCITVVNCRRCAKRETHYQHRLRREPDVRLAFKAHPTVPAQEPCMVYEVCLDCGHGFSGDYEHDREEHPPYRCRRCGDWVDDGDA